MINIQTVTLGNKVTEIGEKAFTGCSSLTSITFPPSLRTICTMAFYSCDLPSVTVPADVDIGDSAFSYNENLTHITIGNGCTIGNTVFVRYMSPPIISSVVIGTGVLYTSTTGIHGGFDSVADPGSSGTLLPGTYEYDDNTYIWIYTP